MIKGPYAHPYISCFVLSPQCSVSSGRLLAWLSVCEMQTCICPSWCHCHSLSLASVKSRLVLPFWYWLTRVVPEKGPLNGCVCVCSVPTPTVMRHDLLPSSSIASGSWEELPQRLACRVAAAAAVVADGVCTKSSQSTSCHCDRLARKSWECGQRKCFSGTKNFQLCL